MDLSAILTACSFLGALEYLDFTALREKMESLLLLGNLVRLGGPAAGGVSLQPYSSCLTGSACSGASTSPVSKGIG